MFSNFFLNKNKIKKMSIIDKEFIDKLYQVIQSILKENDTAQQQCLLQPKQRNKNFYYQQLNKNFCQKIVEKFENLNNNNAEHQTKLHSWFNSDLDVIPNEYEGGLKIWEGLFDLIDYFEQNKYDFNQLLSNNDDEFRICDLGCGSGLLSLYLARKLRQLKPNQKFRIYLQDYNEQVIKFFTCPTIIVNEKEENNSLEQIKLNYEFIWGDWEKISEFFITNKIHFNLIVTAETIYKEENFPKLINLFQSNIQPTNGRILIASKSHYFGIGGGTYSFLDYLDSLIENKSSYLMGDIIEEIDQSLLRHIIELRLSESQPEKQ
ncbi:histidine protein methyltransferase 1 homolog [Dermatophagoides pteronyssinus]|uniref:histidine protein methyltransferase 1 homolog n=1 Tax=Dermatophagoides pteronyssinus TaxID=6956 RepID=UPI003F662E3E